MGDPSSHETTIPFLSCLSHPIPFGFSYLNVLIDFCIFFFFLRETCCFLTSVGGHGKAPVPSVCRGLLWPGWGSNPPSMCMGGPRKICTGWWAGKGITACQMFKLFFTNIYKCHGPALVNKGSFGDT
ncbi:unnamed protein product [Pipistrellus nathusii]|uniref:Uncharacterized protein n=1 Tax=Pipistrellus nathusii TaxID=59473 RepID=A0ABN9ZI24_PIPNA